MTQRKKTSDPNDRGYAPHDPKNLPLPDQRTAEHGAIEHDATDLANVSTGIQTGQTKRGSYGTDPRTGAGRYMDHNGVVTSRRVASPGNDQEKEPDEVDPKI